LDSIAQLAVKSNPTQHFENKNDASDSSGSSVVAGDLQR
jgi:hypothetical protein